MHASRLRAARVDDLHENTCGVARRILRDPAQGNEALGGDLQILAVIADEKEQGLDGPGLDELLVANAVYGQVREGADSVLEDVLVLHELASDIEQHGHGLCARQQLAVLLATREIRQCAQGELGHFPVIVCLASGEGVDDDLEDAALSKLHADLGVRRQVAEDAATLLHEDGVVPEPPHGAYCRLNETEANDILPVLLVAGEAANDAQGRLDEARVVRRGLQHGGQRREPAGGQQRVLHVLAFGSASPDCRSDGGPGVHCGARGGLGAALRPLVLYRVVERRHERIDAAMLEDSQTTILFDREVAQEATCGDHKGRPTGAPLQYLHQDGDATVLRQRSSVPGALGQNGQRRDGVLQQRCVVLVLPQQVDDDGDRAQAGQDLVGLLDDA
mmetsp:Transcript_107815/g.310531  ORF Transcript_107815/g.310531 Transcript_107815/m.310531 type:complete len:389 (+) Transcript_107815:627-1793(+)